MIWMARSRWRGPSSSAAMMAWNCPSTSLPLATGNDSAWPSSVACRCEWAFWRSQSECSGSLWRHSVVRAHDLVEHGLHVVQQRGLPLVDEQRDRRVQRREQHHPLLDVVALDDVADLLGEVVELEPLVGDEAQGLGDHAEGLQPFLRHGVLLSFSASHRGHLAFVSELLQGPQCWWPPLRAAAVAPAWNEWPQPQVEVAFGFLMAKPPPIRSSL